MCTRLVKRFCQRETILYGLEKKSTKNETKEKIRFKPKYGNLSPKNIYNLEANNELEFTAWLDGEEKIIDGGKFQRINFQFDLENDLLKVQYRYSEKLEKDKLRYAQKIYNQFITYLTYRSNGSPKKLKAWLDYYSIQIKYKNFVENTVDGQIFTTVKNSHDSSTYLKFTPLQQYKLGLLHSIFGSFLENKKSYRSRMNDRNLYLSAYLMDHILKFHKSAFSWLELESLPDIIMSNQGVNLRNTLQEILDHLLVEHIRETNNAMFQYKFRSEISNELQYISKISDESAAAYNFTYGESYLLKSYFKRKLKQKMDRYTDQTNARNKMVFDHTISFLNTTIANIHLYDEEYDAALRYYADAMQPLREALASGKKLTHHQRILLLKNRLFLSLGLEKSKRYDSAYSVLRASILDNALFWEADNLYRMPGSSTDNSWESPFKRMQLFLRPHLALLMVLEKDRSDGLTMDNLKRNITEYCDFMGLKTLFPAEPFKSNLSFEDFKLPKTTRADHKRIHTLLADYYQTVGSILFYKNRNFEELYKIGKEGILEKYFGFDDVQNFGKLNHSQLASYSALFYYLISLSHLIIPYMKSEENHSEDGDYGKKVFETLIRFSKKANASRLSGKELELIGLVTSKLADCILTISEFSGFSGVNPSKIDNLMEFQRSENNLPHPTDDFFSFGSFINLSFISFSYFDNAGNEFSASHQVEKVCYAVMNMNLKSHLHTKLWALAQKEQVTHEQISNFLEKNTLEITQQDSAYVSDKMINIFKAVQNDTKKKENLKELFTQPINLKKSLEDLNKEYKSLQIGINRTKLTIVDYYKRIQDRLEKYSAVEFLKFFLGHSDGKEGKFLKESHILAAKKPEIELVIQKLGLKCSKPKKAVKSESNDNIYQRIFHLWLLYQRNDQNDYSKEEYKQELLNTIPLYPECFKLSHTFKSEIYKTLKDDTQAKHHEKLAHQVHSEGLAYKKMIKNTYLLLDDLNDISNHSFAAIERFAINQRLEMDE